VKDKHSVLQHANYLHNSGNTAGPKEGVERNQRLLARAREIPPERRANVLRVQGGAADLAGDDRLAVERTQESVELYRQLGDDRGVALVEQMLAVSAWRQEDWDRMRELTEHSQELAQGRFAF